MGWMKGGIMNKWNNGRINKDMNEGANERNNKGMMRKKGEIDIGWMRWRKGWKKKKKW